MTFTFDSLSTGIYSCPPKQLLSEVSPHLDPNQLASREKRGTENAPLTMTNNISEHLNQTQSLIKVGLVDLSPSNPI